MPNRWIVVVGVPVGPEVGSGALLMHIDITAWVSERKADDELSPDRQMPVTLNSVSHTGHNLQSLSETVWPSA